MIQSVMSHKKVKIVCQKINKCWCNAQRSLLLKVNEKQINSIAVKKSAPPDIFYVHSPSPSGPVAAQPLLSIDVVTDLVYADPLKTALGVSKRIRKRGSICNDCWFA